ncbi:dicarboxylate/amino acid:cation symporter [Gleimia hominis]|uniref:Dicarboxylate/amino acid:cation symporter n=1 Tax=Gleimia hominis TaxID=595468 RepID=A0ABU3ICW1_9ACTO|nr:dicarboxylate/amino acid:cation symporter [Gleimia hominis]MDT3768108.1 dicarboxylate/amino acid:cation symporter [Gleimia hominis]
MVKTFRRLPLYVWILIAIVLAVICGQFFPTGLARVFFTFNSIFGTFIGFAIPLIIIGLVTPALAELGSGSAKWILLTTAIAYVSTMIAGFGTWGVSHLVLPPFLQGQTIGALDASEHPELEPYFTVANAHSGDGVEIVVAPVMDVMTALILAFVIGIGVSLVRGTVVKEGFREFRVIVVALVEKILIPLLPLHIFGIFMNLTMSGDATRVISTFLAVVVMTFSLCMLILLLQYALAGAVAHRNPLKSLWAMKDAFLTALGSSSSAATIPVTLECARRNGVSKPVASFVVPLCATIHLSGSAIKITGFSLAILFLTGGHTDFASYAPFILMLGVMMIAAPGVPGGAIAAAAGLLSSMLGFNDAQVGLMFATYIALDSFGTATNVTGDGAIAMIIDRLAGKQLGAHAGGVDDHMKEA